MHLNCDNSQPRSLFWPSWHICSRSWDTLFSVWGYLDRLYMNMVIAYTTTHRCCCMLLIGVVWHPCIRIDFILLLGWLADWLVGWLVGWLIDQLIDWLVGWLVYWLIDLSIDWLTDWLSDWLVDWLTDWLIDPFSNEPYLLPNSAQSSAGPSWQPLLPSVLVWKLWRLPSSSQMIFPLTRSAFDHQPIICCNPMGTRVDNLQGCACVPIKQQLINTHS